jgi:hypothetical protein
MNIDMDLIKYAKAIGSEVINIDEVSFKAPK